MQKDIRSLQLRLAGIAEELRELEEIVEAGEPGPEGPAGPQGPAGPTGDDGEGVPTGGTAGQVLAKIDGTDYNTEWVTSSGGGGTLGDLAALDTVGSNEIDDGAVTDAKLAQEYINTTTTTQTKAGNLKVRELGIDQGPFRCNNYTYGDDMPVIDGFIAVPKGSNDDGRGFELRFDTMQTAHLLHETGATWTQLSGTEPSTYEKHSLFTANTGYFDLYSLRDSNDEWSFEVTGFALGGSSNNQWKPMLFFHSGSHVINAKVEFLAGDGTTWSTAYDDSVTNGVVFPANYAIVSPGNLKGIRVTITDLTSNCYLKQVGATSKTSPSFAWQMLQSGGSFYGNIRGRKDGADTWSINQTGSANFAAVTQGGNSLGDLAFLNTLPGSKITDDTINSSKIRNYQITSNKIETSAVTSAKIANAAVTADKISNGAVTVDKVGAGAVTSVKLADNAVTSFKLNNGSVTTDKISNGAVTANKVGAGAVTDWQLDSNYEKKLVYKLQPVEPFMPWAGEVVGTYSNRRTYNPLELDRFLGRGSELVMDLDGTTLSETQKRDLTNQSYGNAVTIAAAGGNTGVLTIDMQTNGMVGSNGFVYAQGLLMLTFYSGWGPVSMSARTKDRDGNWTARTCTAHMTSSNTPGAHEAVYWEVSLTGNYVVEIELTMTSQSGQKCSLGNISYLGTRMTMPEGPQINTLGGKFFGEVGGRLTGSDTWSISQAGAADFDSVAVEGRPVLPANQFYDSAGGYVYTVYGVNSNWQATRADSSGMLSSATQTSNLPTVLSGVSGLTYS